jgi:hypothetical protein
MADRLVVGVLGNHFAGKSYTCQVLVGGGRGAHDLRIRKLQLRKGEYVDAFVISRTCLERHASIRRILKGVTCPIILCSIRYDAVETETLRYFIDNGFDLYIQWLNPGRNGKARLWDELGWVNQILSAHSLMSIRSARGNPKGRIQEIREFIYGWALYRDLIKTE